MPPTRENLLHRGVEMPELPEVEIIVRGLRPLIIGKTVDRVEIFLPRQVMGNPLEFKKLSEGRKVIAIDRAGKAILVKLDRGSTIYCHLRMTGNFRYYSQPREKPDGARVVFHLSPGGTLEFHDSRTLGHLGIFPTRGIGDLGYIKNLGPDALKVPSPEFHRRVSRRHRAIKGVLLDQSVVSGLGNIYVDESLFQAGIHPERPASSLSGGETRKLHESIRRILAAAIKAGGTTISTHIDPGGRIGNFQASLRIYGRQGLPCVNCGTPIEKTRVAGRGTHYCPTCQPPP